MLQSLPAHLHGLAQFEGVNVINRSSLILAVRPWSFSITAVSVTIGSLLALIYLNTFNIWFFLITLAGMIIVHAATNLINDYFDVKHGVDKPGAPTTQYRPHPVLTGQLRPQQALLGALVLYAIAALIGLFLYLERGWPVAAIAIIGGLASFFYTGGSFKYKYIALGEFSVFLMWGPLMFLGSYFVQTASWENVTEVILASLPMGIWVALVLLANNLRDIPYDKSVGIKTLGILLGREKTLSLYTILVLLTYAIVIAEAILQILPLWSFLALLTVPLAIKLIGALKSSEEIPQDADPKTAQLATLFGLLIIISLLIDALVF